MKTTLAAVSGMLLLTAWPGHAHRLDEYLQATTVALEKGRVQVSMRLIPGVAIIPVVLASIDTDANGVISEVEQRAHAKRVQHDLSLVINGERPTLRLISSTFPDIETLKEGLGEIQLEFAADAPRAGNRHKLVFENRHQSAIGTYLVNSLIPRDEAIRITAQNRSYDQSSYELDYVEASTQSFPGLGDWSGSWGWADIAGLLLLTGAALVWRHYRVTIGIRQT